MISFSDIVCSSLDTKSVTVVNQVISALSSSGLLTSDEKSALKILETSLTSKSVPSREFFLSSCENLDQPSSDLDEGSLMSAVSLFIDGRRNVDTSRKLMSIASDIATKGMDNKTFAALSGIVASAVKADDTEYIDPLDNPENTYSELLNTTKGIKFGVNAIDDAIGGIHPGSFNVIFAYTGGFKTTCAVNIAYSSVMNNPVNAVYISLEVVKNDLMWDLYARHSFEMHSPEYPYIGHEKMRRATLSDKEREFLFKKVVPDWKEKKKGNLYLLDETDFDSLNFMGFEKALRNIESRAIRESGHGIDVIFVDQANLLKFGTKNSAGSEGSIINEWVSWFRQQCISFLNSERPIAVIMLAQANREGWKRAAKNSGAYDLRAISEANELERAAWRVFAIFTDENMKQSKEAKVQLLKNRTGLTVVDPVTIFVDPAAYVFGDVGSGYSSALAPSSLDDVFSDVFDDDSLFL